MKNVAIEIMKAAVAQGYSLAVISEHETLYDGKSWDKAWEACKAVEECSVRIVGSGGYIGSMYVIPGLDPEEVAADTSGDWVNREWDRVFKENEAA